MWKAKLLGLACTALTAASSEPGKWPYSDVWKDKQVLASMCVSGVVESSITMQDYCKLTRAYARDIASAMGVKSDQVTDGCGTPGLVTLFKPTSLISSMDTVYQDISCPCKAQCSDFNCPAEHKLKPNAFLLEGSSKEVCCDQVCSGMQCPDGYVQIVDSQVFVGNTADICCEPLCSQFNCGTGYSSKPLANRIRGFDLFTCCEKTCESYPCPGNYRLVDEPSKIQGSNFEQCCKQEDGVSPPPAPAPVFLPPSAPEVLVPVSAEEKSCSVLVANTACPEGYQPKPNLHSLTKSRVVDCCDPLCSIYQHCGAHHVLKINAAALVQPQPNLPEPERAAIRRDACCDKLCTAIEFKTTMEAAGWRRKKEFYNLRGVNSVCDCYDELCSMFKCPMYYKSLPDADQVVGNTTSTCCLKVCSGFTCAPPYVPLPFFVADAIHGSSNEICCAVPSATPKLPGPLPVASALTETCATFSCGIGYRHKPNAVQIQTRAGALNYEMCCDKTCVAFTCPPNHDLKPLAENIVGDTAGMCCDKLCSGFECPENFVPKPSALFAPGFSKEVCCDEAPAPAIEYKDCSDFHCPDNMVLKPNAILIQALTLSQKLCCDQMCSSFQCSEGSLHKPNSRNLVGESQEVCCDKSCSGFKCPSGSVLKTFSNIPGDDACTCCDQLCSSYTCPTYMGLKETAAEIVGASVSACCEQMCSGFPCPPGAVLKAAAFSIRGFNKELCCEEPGRIAPPVLPPLPAASQGKNCVDFYNDNGKTCGKHSWLKPGSASRPFYSKAECCDQLCSGYTCPETTKLIAAADSTVGRDMATCCEATGELGVAPPTIALPRPQPQIQQATCADFVCGSGYKSKLNPRYIKASDIMSCCVETCGLFICPPDAKRISNADEVAGQDEKTCCVRNTCATFQCLQDYQLKPNPSQIYASSNDACCDQLCSSMVNSCKNDNSDRTVWLLKPEADTIVGNTKEVCCHEACHCPVGSKIRIEQMNGKDVCTGCDKLCSGVVCPKYMMLVENAADVLSSDVDTCCRKACSGYSCPAGMHLVGDAETHAGDEEETCCSQDGDLETCESFNCREHGNFQLKPSPQSLTYAVRTKELCCDAVCSAVLCPPPLWRDRPNKDTMVGSTVESCCEQSCHDYACPLNSRQSDGFHLMGSGECCVKLCSGVTCPRYMQLRVNYQSLDGDTAEECCDQMCSGHTCSAGFRPKATYLLLAGSDDAACCDQVCSSIECPEGSILLPDAELRLGSSVATCCTELNSICFNGLITATAVAVSKLNQTIKAGLLDRKIENTTVTTLQGGAVVDAALVQVLRSTEQLVSKNSSFSVQFLSFFDKPSAATSAVSAISGIGLLAVVGGVATVGILISMGSRLQQQDFAGQLLLRSEEEESYSSCGTGSDEEEPSTAVIGTAPHTQAPMHRPYATSFTVPVATPPSQPVRRMTSVWTRILPNRELRLTPRATTSGQTGPALPVQRQTGIVLPPPRFISVAPRQA